MKKVVDFAERFDLLPHCELLLAAVSGGMDSMCLLDFLYENGYRVCAAHFNHRLRGEESDQDEELVRAWCAARRIPLCVGSEDAALYARAHALSIEEGARELRYGFLARMADQTGAVRILTAHHANDNAETVLFHLARGTGLTGLCGIPPRAGKLARPFLCLTREEIEAYAREHRVPYRSDSTNADTALSRNFLRAEVLPKLEQVNPQAVEHIAQTALRLREEDRFLDSLAAEHLTELTVEKGAAALPASAVVSAPAVLRARMLRLMFDRLGAGKKDMTAAHYEALVQLCLGTGRAQLDLPSGVTAQRADGTLTLCVRREAEALARVVLHAGETVRWGDFTISCRMGGEMDEGSEGAVQLKSDVLAMPLTVGTWDARESMTLPVSRGARSLKRLFAERGVEPAARERTPVLRAGGAVAAVYGIGTDALFLPAEGEVCCVVEWKRTAE